MEEQWKDVTGYEGFYQISTLGRVKSIRFNRFLNPTLSGKGKGYPSVQFSKENKPIRVRIHQLVAKAFIPNPENKEQVNHIDGNKLNNNVTNLEWNTRSENIKHAYNNGLKTPIKGKNHGRYKHGKYLNYRDKYKKLI